MIYDTMFSIAIKNSYNIYDLKKCTVFQLKNLEKKFTSVESVDISGKEFKIKIKCPLCGEYHLYKYSINELMNKEMVIGGCEILGYPIIYLGNYKKVKQKVDRYIETNKEVYAMM